MSEKLQVVTLLGSLRKGSFNGMVARTLPKIAPASMEVNALPSIADIPLYDADVQQEDGFPATVEALAEQIRQAGRCGDRHAGYNVLGTGWAEKCHRLAFPPAGSTAGR